MNAVYEGRVAANCYKSHVYSAGEFGGTATPLRHTVPVALITDGEHFHGEFFVDQFLPGKCGWHLHIILAVLSKDNVPDAQVVIAQALDSATSVNSQDLESAEKPSFVHVKYSGAGGGWLSVPRQHEKSSQEIGDSTHHIETNIIDDSAQ